MPRQRVEWSANIFREHDQHAKSPPPSAAGQFLPNGSVRFVTDASMHRPRLHAVSCSGEGSYPMLVNLPLVAVGPLVDWLSRRAEQKAQLKAMDELTESPNDLLSDIGISRDDIETTRLRSGRRVVVG